MKSQLKKHFQYKPEEIEVELIIGAKINNKINKKSKQQKMIITEVFGCNLIWLSYI